MNKCVKKLLSCFVVIAVVVMGLTVSAFAGAPTGDYYGGFELGAYYVYCELSLDSTTATGTARLPEFGFVKLSVSLVGYYKTATSGDAIRTTGGNSAEWYSVTASMSNGGGTWTDVTGEYGAKVGQNGQSGSTVLTNS